ncbi:MAG: DUF1343 domain-containing protein [FCB group bacterium]|nr:DUF1343 domain-containing protein [FCB group bacterium]
MRFLTVAVKRLSWLILGALLLGQPSSFEYTTLLKVPDFSFFPGVMTGLDVLEQMDFAPLRGKRIAVCCNATSIDRNGRHLLNLLAELDSTSIPIIFIPEYGLSTSLDERMVLMGDEDHDPVTGARLVDLFGSYVKPPEWSLRMVDMVLIDLQDTGLRYNTYITTITKIMEVAGPMSIPVMVLDRPNPLRGDVLDGPVIRPQFQSFQGYHLTPIRHGLTLGEETALINEMGWVKDLTRVELTIVPMANWKRSMWFEDTGLPWIAPLPMLETVDELLSYAGLALAEAANVNVGIGTRKPYLRIGAPWLNGPELKDQLIRLSLPGVEFRSIQYVPRRAENSSRVPQYDGKVCGGIQLRITDRNAFEAVRTGTSILTLLYQLNPQEFRWLEGDYAEKLFGTSLLRILIAQKKDPDYLWPQWQSDLVKFDRFRKRFFLYE